MIARMAAWSAGIDSPASCTWAMRFWGMAGGRGRVLMSCDVPIAAPAPAPAPPALAGAGLVAATLTGDAPVGAPISLISKLTSPLASLAGAGITTSPPDP